MYFRFPKKRGRGVALSGLKPQYENRWEWTGFHQAS